VPSPTRPCKLTTMYSVAIACMSLRCGVADRLA
jgi:hypothetical protein